MRYRWYRRAIRNYVFVILCFPTLLFANFNYRPEYAQSSKLAYVQALGFASIILPYSYSSIMQIPSLLYDTGQSSFSMGYGSTQFGTHAVDIAYVSPIVGGISNMIFGFEYIANFIPNGTFLDKPYFKGRIDTLGFEQVFTSAIAYSFDKVGTFGLNIKVPIDSYQEGVVNGGILLNASYDIEFFGFNFMVGIANLGGMYVDQKFLGVYPDIQMGVGYNYYDSNNELVFNLGMAAENNLGELISDSFIFAIGGRIRLFSTGLLRTKPLIEDNILVLQDGQGIGQANKQDALSQLYANIYLNIGFQFDKNPRFSIGVTSAINDYMLDLGIVFPGTNTKRFGIYVSFGRNF